jgi:hypothetical protein
MNRALIALQYPFILQSPNKRDLINIQTQYHSLHKIYIKVNHIFYFTFSYMFTHARACVLDSICITREIYNDIACD